VANRAQYALSENEIPIVPLGNPADGPWTTLDVPETHPQMCHCDEDDSPSVSPGWRIEQRQKSLASPALATSLHSPTFNAFISMPQLQTRYNLGEDSENEIDGEFKKHMNIDCETDQSWKTPSLESDWPAASLEGDVRDERQNEIDVGPMCVQAGSVMEGIQEMTQNSIPKGSFTKSPQMVMLCSPTIRNEDLSDQYIEQDVEDSFSTYWPNSQ
jgi:hypothetical protein